MQRWIALVGCVTLLTLFGCREEPKPLSTGQSGTSHSNSASGTDPSSSAESGESPNLGGNVTDKPSSGQGDAELPPGERKNGKTAPAGRVFCDICGGHMPKEDSVIIDGKTLCLADAEEYKAKKK